MKNCTDNFNTLKSEIKAVIFDFDGTLVDEDYWFKKRWEKTINYAESKLNLPKFGEVFWKIYEEKGLKYKYHVTDTLKKLKYNNNYSSEIIDKFLSETIEEKLMDGALQCLDLFKNRYRIGLITNGSQEIQSRRIINAGILDYFTVIVYANDNKKPSVEPFLECLNKMDVVPKHTLCIGNEYEIDIRTPKILGMITVLLNTKIINCNYHESDYQVKSLNDLLELFQGENNHGV